MLNVGQAQPGATGRVLLGVSRETCAKKRLLQCATRPQTRDRRVGGLERNGSNDEYEFEGGYAVGGGSRLRNGKMCDGNGQAGLAGWLR